MLLLLLTILPLLQNSAPQQNTKPEHHQTPSTKSASSNTPSAANAPSESSSSPNVYYNSTGEKGSSKQQDQPWWKRPSITDWTMVALTLAYVGVNIFILLAIRRQSEISEKARKDFMDQAASSNEQFSSQLETMKSQLEAMKSAAVEARRQVDAIYAVSSATKDTAQATKASIDTLIAIERAWVEVRVEGHTAGPIYYFRATNFGRTPAIVISYEIECEFSKFTVDAEELPTTKKSVASSRLLAQNQPWDFFNFNFIIEFGRDRWDALLKGEIGVVLSGTVHYWDIADNLHASSFKYVWDKNAHMLLPLNSPTYRTYT